MYTWTSLPPPLYIHNHTHAHAHTLLLWYLLYHSRCGIALLFSYAYMSRILVGIANTLADGAGGRACGPPGSRLAPKPAYRTSVGFSEERYEVSDAVVQDVSTLFLDLHKIGRRPYNDTDERREGRVLELRRLAQGHREDILGERDVSSRCWCSEVCRTFSMSATFCMEYCSAVLPRSYGESSAYDTMYGFAYREFLLGCAASASCSSFS